MTSVNVFVCVCPVKSVECAEEVKATPDMKPAAVEGQSEGPTEGKKFTSPASETMI